MRYFVRVEVKKKNAGIFICQQKYSNEILTRFGMDQCNKVCNPIVLGYRLNKDENGKRIDATSYKQMVGSLVARYMERPTKIHPATTKRILRYIKGTMDL